MMFANNVVFNKWKYKTIKRQVLTLMKDVVENELKINRVMAEFLRFKFKMNVEESASGYNVKLWSKIINKVRPIKILKVSCARK